MDDLWVKYRTKKLNSFRVKLTARYPFSLGKHDLGGKNGKEPIEIALGPIYMPPKVVSRANYFIY